MATSLHTADRESGTRASFTNLICVGELHLANSSSKNGLAVRKLYMGHDLTIGRDANRCQWVLQDPYLSGVHLRVYTIAYNDDDDERTEHLVYAEDSSRNGTFWNGSLIGKGRGGFLLSHDDQLRLSSQTLFCFKSTGSLSSTDRFDFRQETEMAYFRREYIVTDRLLGSGGFGKVYMAIEQHRRTQVACKVIDLHKLKQTKSEHFPSVLKTTSADRVSHSSQLKRMYMWAERQGNGSRVLEQTKTCYREADLLSELSHPNIIGLHKVYITNDTIYMFQDLITAGDLLSYIESKNGRLLEVEAAVIIRQVVVALKFLHERDIVHRDLKPENILMTGLSTGCRVVLTDFGAARQVRSTQRMLSVVGSEYYAAPEVHTMAAGRGSTRVGYTKSVDMWSVGTITVVLLTGCSAFEDPSTGSYSAILARTCNLKSLQKSREWRQIRLRPQDFVIKLLVLDERERMTARQALEHSWFSNEIHKVDFEELYQRTIKNWHPRVAKIPVVEHVKPPFARKSTPVSRGPTTRRHSRQELKSVDPPYKPFPRDMHIPLWPKRNPANRTMSAEVKDAIAKVWTARPETTHFRLTSHSSSHKHHSNETEANILGTVHLQMSDPAVDGIDMQNRSAVARPLPSMSVNLPKAVAQEEQHTVQSGMVTASAHPDVVENVQGSSNKARNTHLSSRSSTLLTRRSPSLRRSSICRSPASQAQKRGRDTIFDLQEEESRDMCDTAGNDVLLTPSKKQKMSYSEDTVVSAHNASIMLALEDTMEERSLYLPRI